MLSLFGRRTARMALLGSTSRLSLSRTLLRQLSSASSSQHVVVALGGNALLRRGEEMTIENQRRNIAEGMQSLKQIVHNHTITLVHGNGPQVGLLVLETAEYEKQTGLPQMSLDVLDAETEGQIGYMLEQQLQGILPPGRGMATVLSQIIVDPSDPAFDNPTKFIGPVYTKQQADQLGLPVKPDGDKYRRVVPSPRPVRLLEHEQIAVQLLTQQNCVVICAGGGGIPVVIDQKTGLYHGIEAVIDKDRAACMLGISLQATVLLILTDVTAVATNFGTDQQKWIKRTSPDLLEGLLDHFPDGSMGPKVEAAMEFVRKTAGGWAAIGSLKEADDILEGTAGTRIESNVKDIEYHSTHSAHHHAA